jgi:hypothetical protein
VDPDIKADLDAKLERLEKRTCGWCGVWMPYDGKGRPRTYCSKAHRNRAWEVRSAQARLDDDLAAGRATAEPVREVVSRPAPAPPAPKVPYQAAVWVEFLAELSGQLRDGQLGKAHWQHLKLMNALFDTLDALNKATPGGLENLRRRHR